MNNGKKIVLIGCGLVGTSFIYSAINKNLASEYVLIDVFEQAAIGNKLDLQDTLIWQDAPAPKIKNGNYDDCKDADVIVITAGRPQKPGETRLDLVSDNAKIMSDIIEKVKISGFKGIILIASNPVDILTYVAQKVSGFDKNRVFGSGTILDSSRLMFELSQHFDVAPSSVTAYIAGEHGDSSAAFYSVAKINGKNLNELKAVNKIDEATLKVIHKTVINKAYEIIKCKRATYYGIGSSLTRIVRAVLTDEKVILPVGAYLFGEYGQKDIYTGIPAIVGKNGIEKVIELDISKTEKDQFTKSCETIHQLNKVAMQAIKKE